MANDERLYRELSPEQKIAVFVNEVTQSLSLIIGYIELLKLESQKPEVQGCIPSEFLTFYDDMFEAAQRILDERNAIVGSMRPPPPDVKVG